MKKEKKMDMKLLEWWLHREMKVFCIATGLIFIVFTIFFLANSSHNSYTSRSLLPCQLLDSVLVPAATSSQALLISNSTTTTSTSAAVSAVIVAANRTVSAVELKPVEEENLGDRRIIRRSFQPYGSAAYVFIKMSAYRGGDDTFAVIGLASKPLHVFGKPKIECRWNPGNTSLPPVTVNGTKYLPDWGYGRVYTVVVVNCTFPVPVGIDGSGGELVLLAHHAPSEEEFFPAERILALTEPAESLNLTVFSGEPEFDYIYCGSCLFGNLSPQRIREWLAYHVRLFGGEKVHFVFHDAGGVHPEVFKVMEPWMELGYITLQDIKDEEKFDGYYHNQFMVVNDCLHRYKFKARWIFYFDVDEYLYVPMPNTLKMVMESFSNYTQFTIEQMPMSNKLCILNDYRRVWRQWGFEKLVFEDTKRGIRRDRKYAIQPRYALASGVHMSENVVGATTHKTEGRIMYYHYHDTISSRREPCRKYVNVTELTFEGLPYAIDDTLRQLTPVIRKFEQTMIGDRLAKTPQ